MEIQNKSLSNQDLEKKGANGLKFQYPLQNHVSCDSQISHKVSALKVPLPLSNVMVRTRPLGYRPLENIDIQTTAEMSY